MAITHAERFSQYRTMWVLVFFDLPTETKAERKRYAKFRKDLLNDGFAMVQLSIYARHCASAENAKVHIRRVRAILPVEGKVCMLTVTDKQFGNMETYHGAKAVRPMQEGYQLELF